MTFFNFTDFAAEQVWFPLQVNFGLVGEQLGR